MDEAVGDGAGGGGVVKELAPVLEGQIGRDHGGGSLSPSTAHAPDRNSWYTGEPPDVSVMMEPADPIQRISVPSGVPGAA